MKILIDARMYGLEHAGIGRYVSELVQAFAKESSDHEFVLLLRKNYFESLSLPSNFKKVLADFRHYSVAEQLRLPGIIKRVDPDISHFPHFNVPVGFRGKYVVTVHDLLMHKQKGSEATTLPMPLYFTKRLAYKTVFRQGVMNSSAIITPSLAVKDEVIGYYKIYSGKVNVIYEAAHQKTHKVRDIELSNYGLKHPYFIYTGSAYPHKNLDRAVKAVKLLNQHSEIQFAIVCSRNIFTEKLEKIIAKYYATKEVNLLGFVPDEELAALYKHSLGFVFPSLSEGFGLPGLEAMSAGAMVLASDIPVFKEIYGESAIYFDPYREESIAEAMKRVIDLGSEKKARHVAMGQKVVQKYSWEKTAKETLKLYSKVVQG